MISMVKPQRSFSTALLANSGTIPFCDSSIFESVGMTILALCLRSMFRTYSVAAHNVFSLSDRFKMIWVYATWILAKMINIEALRYRTFMDFIGNAVSRTILLLVGCNSYLETPVSEFLVEVKGPFNTIIGGRERLYEVK